MPPESLDTDNQSQENEKVTDGPESSDSSQPSEAEEAFDLDTAKKIRFSGMEYTPDDFRKAVMFQSDYTRKSQALAEERRYYDNLSHDLEKVKGNPELASEFQRVYPEKFHGYLRYVMQEQADKANNPGKIAQVPEEYKKLESRLNSIESEYHERKVAAIEAELDAKFEKLGKKYPMADEETALVRAQVLLDKLRSDAPASEREKVGLTDEHWDRIFKTVHDAHQKRFESFYREKTGKIKDANVRGKDSASGGGIPGSAPVKPKTIKEASALALQELENM